MTTTTTESQVAIMQMQMDLQMQMIENLNTRLETHLELIKILGKFAGIPTEQ